MINKCRLDRIFRLSVIARRNDETNQFNGIWFASGKALAMTNTSFT